MVKLSSQHLREVLRWASRQKDKKGRSLLERARESLETGSWLKYNTVLEPSDREFLSDGTPIIYWDCDCPDAQRRKDDNKMCKHALAKLILLHEKELRKSPKWDEWFSHYEQAQIQRALKEFDF